MSTSCLWNITQIVYTCRITVSQRAGFSLNVSRLYKRVGDRTLTQQCPRVCDEVRGVYHDRLCESRTVILMYVWCTPSDRRPNLRTMIEMRVPGILWRPFSSPFTLGSTTLHNPLTPGHPLGIPLLRFVCNLLRRLLLNLHCLLYKFKTVKEGEREN